MFISLAFVSQSYLEQIFVILPPPQEYSVLFVIQATDLLESLIIEFLIPGISTLDMSAQMY